MKEDSHSNNKSRGMPFSSRSLREDSKKEKHNIPAPLSYIVILKKFKVRRKSMTEICNAGFANSLDDLIEVSEHSKRLKKLKEVLDEFDIENDDEKRFAKANKIEALTIDYHFLCEKEYRGKSTGMIHPHIEEEYWNITTSNSTLIGANPGKVFVVCAMHGLLKMNITGLTEKDKKFLEEEWEHFKKWVNE